MTHALQHSSTHTHYMNPVLTFQEYQEHPAVSRSDLLDLYRSPLHYWSKHIDPNRSVVPIDSPALQFGIATHMAVLEPERFKDSYVEGPSVPAKSYKAWKDAEAVAKVPLLTPKEMSAIKAICQNLKTHPSAKEFCYGPGSNETAFIANDPNTGIELKCLADRLTDDNIIVDLKTTKNASLAEFSKSVLNFNYHVQAAFYLKVVQAATGTRPKGFIFVAVEKEPPYAIQVFNCTHQLIAKGNQIVESLLLQLQRYQEALKNGVSPEKPWRSYSNNVTDLNLPAWA